MSQIIRGQKQLRISKCALIPPPKTTKEQRFYYDIRSFIQNFILWHEFYAKPSQKAEAIIEIQELQYYIQNLTSQDLLV